MLIADPALASTPAIRSLGGIRAAAAMTLVVAAVALIVLGGPWLASGRAALEALLGIPIGQRGRAPRRLSPGRWRPLIAAVAPDREAWWATERVPSAPGSAVVVLVSVAAGAALLATGLALELIARSAADAARATSAVAGGGVLVTVGAVLAIPIVRSIRRREIVALRNAVRETLPAARPQPLVVFALAVPLAVGVAIAIATTDGARCETVGARCIELVMPADRRAGDPHGPTITVRFAHFPSSAPDPGLLVIAVGGPGASGIDDAEFRLSTLDDRIRRAFDVVLFDLRGVAASNGRHCRVASRAYDQTGFGDPDGARRFVEACVREAGVAADELPYYRTEQVVGDIEALRAYLGHPQLVLYGESYGTELAQAYAITHPDHVDTLVLDAPVDLGLTSHEFWLQAAQGFDDVLRQTFAACAEDPVCRQDLPEPLEAYRAVVARLSRGPQLIEVSAARGGLIEQRVTLDAFESVVGTSMYDEAGRALVLRALAEAARGEWDHVARLAGDQAVTWQSDPISDFAYHAFTCGDEPYAPAGGVREYLLRADASGVDEALLGHVYFSGLPCIFWPAPPAAASPGLSAAPFPVIVLTATADPITRASAARALAERQPRGYLVETVGGRHVTFAGGDPCVDDVVAEWLVDRREPRPVTRCSGYVTDLYAELTPLDADDYAGPLAAVGAIEAELWAAPELYWWDGRTKLELGCRFGGGTRLAWDGSQVLVTLFDCAWAEGLAVDGNGTLDFDTGRVELRIVAPDTDVRYVSDFDGRSLEGTWAGKAIAERD